MNKNKFSPIETFFNCDDQEGGKNLSPVSLYSISIHHNNVDGGEILISGQDLIDQLITLSTVSNNTQLDGVKYASPAGKKIGQYFKISGYYEYFRLRDAYKTYLKENSNVNGTVDFDSDSIHFERNLSYFTHLLLEATTEQNRM